jgi:hypothetical protein
MITSVSRGLLPLGLPVPLRGDTHTDLAGAACQLDGFISNLPLGNGQAHLTYLVKLG